jgi:hypothetical protein
MAQTTNYLRDLFEKICDDAQRALNLLPSDAELAFCRYFVINSPIAALSLRSFSNSAPRPASAQKDSIIWAAMRFAAAISFVPVLRNITRRVPLMAGVVNRTYQLFLDGGGGCK